MEVEDRWWGGGCVESYFRARCFDRAFEMTTFGIRITIYAVYLGAVLWLIGELSR